MLTGGILGHPVSSRKTLFDQPACPVSGRTAGRSEGEIGELSERLVRFTPVADSKDRGVGALTGCLRDQQLQGQVTGGFAIPGLASILSDVFMPATDARNPRLGSGKITPRLRRVLESKTDPRLVDAPWLSHCG